jgi:monoamine oxidase
VPDVSFVERAEALPGAAGGAAAIARMALGDEPENISALDYARLWSGDDLVMADGYGDLVRRYGAGLDVRLNTPVAAIDTGGPGVALTTPAGTLTARAAIVTVPVGVLKTGAIRFTPELPHSTQAGLDGLAMGALTKVGLKFNGARFGVDAGVDLWSRLGPRASFDFECWPFGRDIVIAYFGGDHARGVIRQGERAAVETALAEFVRIVGPEARRAFERGVLHGWASEPWSLGCYSHALPGHAGARARLAQPVAGKLFFAGEATGGENFGGAMTAGGAWLAGRDAARAAARLR